MKISAISLFVFGVLLFIGGIMGYSQAASVASLLMGSLFGIVLIGCSFSVYKKRKGGAVLALIALLVLDAFFTYRYVATSKVFPAGVFSLLSLGVLFILVIQMRRRN